MIVPRAAAYTFVFCPHSHSKFTMIVPRAAACPFAETMFRELALLCLLHPKSLLKPFRPSPNPPFFPGKRITPPQTSPSRRLGFAIAAKVVPVAPEGLKTLIAYPPPADRAMVEVELRLEVCALKRYAALLRPNHVPGLGVVDLGTSAAFKPDPLASPLIAATIAVKAETKVALAGMIGHSLCQRSAYDAYLLSIRFPPSGLWRNDRNNLPVCIPTKLNRWVLTRACFHLF